MKYCIIIEGTSMEYLEICQLGAQSDEADVQLAAKVVGKATVVVMDTEVGGADLTDAQLLLLVVGRRHRVAVFILCNGHHGNINNHYARWSLWQRNNHSVRG